MISLVIRLINHLLKVKMEVYFANKKGERKWLMFNSGDQTKQRLNLQTKSSSKNKGTEIDQSLISK